MGVSVVTVHNGVAIIITGLKNKEQRTDVFVCVSEKEVNQCFTGSQVKRATNVCVWACKRGCVSVYYWYGELCLCVYLCVSGVHFGGTAADRGWWRPNHQGTDEVDSSKMLLTWLNTFILTFISIVTFFSPLSCLCNNNKAVFFRALPHIPAVILGISALNDKKNHHKGTTFHCGLYFTTTGTTQKLSFVTSNGSNMG